MLKKISYLVSIITLLMLVGCEDEPVAPLNNSSEKNNKISGETQLVEYISSGSVKHLENGGKQVRNEIAVFNDRSNSSQLSGLRKIVYNHNFDSNDQGECFGVFSIETDEGYWEGDWTGTITSEGTTIRAMGYNFENRDQSCEWTYFFPSSLEGKSGTYSARIFSARD